MDSSISLHTVNDLIGACLSTINQTLLTRNVDPKPIGFQGTFTIEHFGEPNASARQVVFGRPPEYGLTVGLALALLDLSMEVACFRGFLPHIPFDGGITVGQYGQSHERFRRYEITDLNAQPLSLLGRVPESVARSGIGWTLFALGCRYISLHEQAHYIHGHIRLLPTGTLMEMDDRARHTSQQNGGLSIDDFRALELQADSFAINNAAGIVRRDWDSQQDSPEFRAISSNFAEWCMNSFLGAVLVCLVISEANTGNRSKSRHPSPACRIYGLFVMVQEIRTKFGSVSTSEEWAIAIEKSFMGLQAALNVVSSQTAHSVRAILAAYSLGRPHPVRVEYRSLGLKLRGLEKRLEKSTAEIEMEIGGPILTDV